MPTRSKRSSPCLALLFAILAVGCVGLIPATASAAGSSPDRPASYRYARHAIVPVVAEAGGRSSGERLRGASVRAYAIGKPGKEGGGRRRLIARGRTGSLGVVLLRLRTPGTPRRLLVVADGGRLTGNRFGGLMRARVNSAGGHAVFLSPLSSLVVQYMRVHRGKSLKLARRAVRRAYRIPGFFDFATDLADQRIFNGAHFVRYARRHGGFDRYIARRARNLSRRGAHAAAVEKAQIKGTGAGACWHEAAQTSAGFAYLLGFTGVTNPPSLPSCPSGAAVASSATAHASGIPGLEVFGVLTSVASFAYSLASGQSTADQLAEIQAQLNEVQAELAKIQADLGGLQSQIAAVSKNVTNGNITTGVDAAVSTITKIKDGSGETLALVGSAAQILCQRGSGCAKPTGATNLGQALDIACDDETPECEDFYDEVYRTNRNDKSDNPKAAIQNLAAYSMGSAYRGGAGVGIIQYALQLGGEGGQFFTTGDAEYARLQWAYYTLYSTLAQADVATIGSMGVGQPLPNAESAHPPKVKAEGVAARVNALNSVISEMIAFFPNMPDTAVIDTNEGSATKDPPYMFPQQVGALAKSFQYHADAEYELGKNVAGGQLNSTSGGSTLTTEETSGEPPIVLTPAAANGETWQLLPTGNGRRPPLPAISTGYFGDWKPAGAVVENKLPEWNESTLKVEASVGGLAGPLPDLYQGAKPSGSETAGQWMTKSSGIESALLTPKGTGYPQSTAPSGIVPYYEQSGTSSKEPGLAFTECAPAGDEECLLPTWQSVEVEPFQQTTSGQAYNTGSTQLNTGLFDFNTGLVIANQQGHKENAGQGFTQAFASNPTAFLNQYPNWIEAKELRDIPFASFLGALNGVTAGSNANESAYDSNGRPILFSREQTGNDCFYFTGSSSSAADGSGCLTPRDTSRAILP